jgi:thiol-disulfide isomerase/thioredoxin
VSGIGVVVLVAALLLSGGVGWWQRTRSGAVRVPADDATPDAGPHATPDAGPGAADEPPTGPRAVLERLGVRPAEADLTIVQFSTAFCAPCRATRARLDQLRAGHPGLAVVHVDAERELAAVRELDVRRTPTLFYLDRSGRLLGRSSGAPRPEELTALVRARAGAPSSGGGS